MDDFGPHQFSRYRRGLTVLLGGLNTVGPVDPEASRKVAGLRPGAHLVMRLGCLPSEESSILFRGATSEMGVWVFGIRMLQECFNSQNPEVYVDLFLDRVMFLRGVLTAFASSGSLVHYDEVRRLVKGSREMMGELLGAVQESKGPDEPNLCAIVVNDTNGYPGDKYGWGDQSVSDWVKEVRAVHRFWRDRRATDKDAFVEKWGTLPVFPKATTDE